MAEGITVSDVLAGVSLLTTVAVAGRVVVRNETKQESMEKECAQMQGRIGSLEAIAAEGKAAHVGLARDVAAIGAIVGEKASVESVAAVRESVEGLRRDLVAHLERIEHKVDNRNERHRAREGDR